MVYRDYQGQHVRLSDERMAYILRKHPEVAGLEWTIPLTLETPHEVRRSASDPQYVALYYRWYTGIGIGDKYMCVVVKSLETADAFVITAYFTDQLKQGETLWTTPT
jgi:hypothetical protein